MEMIKELFRACKVDMKEENVNRIVRLGRKEEGKTRPILVEMKDSDYKVELFRNISELRNADDEIRKLSVANDLAPEERMEMKRLIEEAKNSEQNDPEFRYRVRGPPWNLVIRKFKK